MVIEEVDSEDDEAVEEIEVDKPLSNDHDVLKSGSCAPASTGSQSKETDKFDECKTSIETAPSANPQQETICKSTYESRQESSEMQSALGGSHQSEEAVCHAPSEDISVSPSKSSSICTSVPPPTSETSALPAEIPDSSISESPLEQIASSQISEISSSTLGESSTEASEAAAQETTESTAEPCAQSHLSRPQFVQLPLPPAVLDLKEEGNGLFRSGQYGEAVDWYSQAIDKLEKGKCMICVNGS